MPPPLNPLTSTVDERAQRDIGRANTKVAAGEWDYQKAKALYEQAARKTDQDLLTEVEDATLRKYPDIDEKNFAELTAKSFAEYKAQHQRQLETMGITLRDAEKAGADKMLADVQKPNEEGFSPSKLASDAGGWLMHQLGRPGRAAQGAVTGLVSGARELTKDVPLDERPMQRFDVPLPKASEWEMLGRNVAAAIPLAPLFIGLPSPELYNDTSERPTADFAIPAARKSLNEPAPDLRILGVPVQAAAERIAADPKKLIDLGKRAIEYAKMGFTADAAQSKADLSQYIKDVKQQYVDQAFDQALQSLPNASDDEITKRAMEIAENNVRADIGPMKHEQIAQILVETVLDPLNFVGAGLGEKAVALGKKLPGVRNLRYAVSPFQTDSIEMLSKIPGDEAASMARLAAGESEGIIRSDVAALRKKYVPILDKLNDVDDRLVYEAATNPDIKVPERLQPAVDAARNLAKETQALKVKHNIGSTFDETGKILPAAERELENYVPRREFQNDEIAEGLDLPPSGQVSPQLSSAKARTGTGENVVPSIKRNWSRELAEIEKRAPAGLELQKLKEYMTDYGLVKELPAAKLEQALDVEKTATSKAIKIDKRLPRLETAARDAMRAAEALKGTPEYEAAKRTADTLHNDWMKLLRAKDKNVVQLSDASQERIAAQMRKDAIDAARFEMNKATGGDFIHLEPKMQEIWDLFNQGKGFERGSNITFVERRIGDRLTALAPLLKPEQFGEQFKAINNFMQEYVRTPQRIWRFNKTMAVPISRIRDAIGNFGLTTIAHGMKAADPRLMKAAGETALVAAGLGNEKALSSLYRLRSGKEITLRQGLDLMNRIGVINQDALRFGMESSRGATKIGRGLQKVDAGLQKLGTAMGTVPLARVADNYQKAAVFLGFLEDTTPQALAKALDLTAKYAGDYRRLTNVEKSFLKEGFGFYAWHRFIVPHLMTQLVEHPQRLAFYEKLHRAAEREFGDEEYYGAESIPKHTQNVGVTSPEFAQPPKESGKRARTVLDDPASMLVGYGNQESAAMIGPFVNLLVEATYSRDPKTGDKVEPINVSSLREFLTSAAGKFAVSYIDRPTKAYMNLINLYRQNGYEDEAESLEARYQAGRDFAMLDHLVGALLDFQAKSKGVPGAPTYIFNPATEFSYTKSNAVRDMQSKSRALQKKQAWE